MELMGGGAVGTTGRREPHWEIARLERRLKVPMGASVIYPKTAAEPKWARRPTLRLSSPALLRD